MGIAYSNKTIISATVRADTSAHFRADIGAALLAAGWTKIRDIADGAVYECTTPDAHMLQARLLVQDQGTHGNGGPYIVFQGMTHSESAAGQIHNIIYGTSSWETTRVEFYQVIVGVCQFFISTVANQRFLFDQSYAFAFGIPSLPPDQATDSDCATGISVPAVTDIWWANGSGSGGYDCPSFRTSPRCFRCADYSLNGVVSSTTYASGTDVSSGMLGLFYLCSTDNTDSWIYVSQAMIRYGNSSPFNLDALIGWQWTIWGSLWDAFQRSQAEILDAIQAYMDEDSTGHDIILRCQVWMSSF